MSIKNKISEILEEKTNISEAIDNSITNSRKYKELDALCKKWNWEILEARFENPEKLIFSCSPKKQLISGTSLKLTMPVSEKAGRNDKLDIEFALNSNKIDTYTKFVYLKEYSDAGYEIGRHMDSFYFSDFVGKRI